MIHSSVVEVIPEAGEGGFTREEFLQLMEEELVAIFSPLFPEKEQDVVQAFSFYFSPWPDIYNESMNRAMINNVRLKPSCLRPVNLPGLSSVRWTMNAGTDKWYHEDLDSCKSLSLGPSGGTDKKQSCSLICLSLPSTRSQDLLCNFQMTTDFGFGVAMDTQLKFHQSLNPNMYMYILGYRTKSRSAEILYPPWMGENGFL